MKTKGFVFQFALKSGRKAYYNPTTNEWGILYDYAQLLEPTIKETAEILNFIVETQMDAWGELFGE